MPYTTLLLPLWLTLSVPPAPAGGPFCPKLQLRATSAPRDGYACSPVADGLAVCYLCDDRPIATAQLSRAGYDLARLEAEARTQAAAALGPARPVRIDIEDMPGSHYWVSADGDGLDVAALLLPARLQTLLGPAPVVAVPGEGTLLAWIPGDNDTDTVIAVGVRRMHDQARRPVSPRVYQYRDGAWQVWGEVAAPPDPAPTPAP